MVSCKGITAVGEMPIAFCELLYQGTSIIVQRKNSERRTLGRLLPKDDAGLAGP